MAATIQQEIAKPILPWVFSKIDLFLKNIPAPIELPTIVIITDRKPIFSLFLDITLLFFIQNYNKILP
ncbi:hypothetical protein MYMA111404_00555 [Mycoplasma marinum]